MSSKPWWTIISSRDFFQLRTRLLRFLDESFSGIVAADREDLAQEALLILIRNKERVLPDDDGLFRYARKVAKNTALDQVKSTARRAVANRHFSDGQVSSRPLPNREASESQTPVAFEESPVSEVCSAKEAFLVAPSTHAQVARNEEFYQIRKIFCELDDLSRLVLWSYVVDGRSINAIAKQLDIGWHQVTYMIEQSLDQFRRRLS